MIDNVRPFRQFLTQQLQNHLDEHSGFVRLSSISDHRESYENFATSTNMLYVLHLLRTKERPNMEQGLKNLERLLFFQSSLASFEGNFPIYLHHYPYCERQFELIDCLLPLYWIHHEFNSVMDEPLKKRLRQSLEKAVSYLYIKMQKQDYSYLLRLQATCVLLSMQEFDISNQVAQWCIKELKKLADMSYQKVWANPSDQGKMLCSFSLLPESERALFQEFFSFLSLSWDFQKGIYIGPSVGEVFFKGQPQSGLIQVLSYLLKGEPKKEGSYLNAMLTHLIDFELFEQIAQAAVPLESNRFYTIARQPTFAYSFFNQDADTWTKTGGYYPLKVVSTNLERIVDEFVLQMGCPVKIESISESELRLVFDTQGDLEPEIYFFWNLSSRTQVYVEKNKCTLFEAHKIFQFLNESFELEIAAESTIEGAWGHIMHRNRSSELEKNHQEIYDKHLYYRFTNIQKEPFVLRIKFSSPKNN